MKKVIMPLFAVLAFTTATFAQDEGENEAENETAATVATESVAEEVKPEEPAKKEKKAPIAVGSKEERPIGIRAGFQLSSVSGYIDAASWSWNLGVLYDVMRIFDIELGGDAFQFRALLEPGVFVAPRKSIFGDSQYWVEAPVTVAFTLSLFGSMRIKYALGPYVAFGTIGTFSKDIAGIELKQSRLDVGQWHTIGFEQNNFKNWWVDVNLIGGLMNTVKVADESVSGSTPFALRFSIGYNF
jgi:hypothetical protein